MVRYIIKRLLQSFITIMLVLTIVFLLMRLMPTDYFFTEDEIMKLTDEQKAYATTDSPEYQRLMGALRDRFALKSLKYTKIEDLIEAIGLPKDKVCTYCFDGCNPAE